jgi:hypothetical protein
VARRAARAAPIGFGSIRLGSLSLLAHAAMSC